MPIFGSASVATVAGTGTGGAATSDTAATAAAVNAPGAGLIDSQGNIYFADTGNNVVRRIDALTGQVATVAGSGSAGYSGDGGVATAALLNAPASVAVDAAGNLYIADTGNNVVRFVSVDTGVMTTIAGNNTANYTGDGGMATAATLNAPQGLLVDAGGNVYVADAGNSAIRRFARNGPIITFAGTGTAGASGDGGPCRPRSTQQPQGSCF